jgi:hypothetical protein
MMDWFFGGYPEPWRTLLRVSFLVFVVVFSANFWSDLNGTVITVVLLAIIAFQLYVRYAVLGNRQR